MSRLITGKSCIRDTNALINTLGTLLEDQDLIGKLKEMSRQGNMQMVGYESNDTAMVNFMVSRRHRNFRKVFGHSYTHVGFRLKNGNYEIHCDEPERLRKILEPAYQETLVKRFAARLKVKVKKQVNQDGNIKLVLYN